MKKIIVTSIAAAALVLSGQAALAADPPASFEPQKRSEVYTSDQLFIRDFDNFAGGTGSVRGEYAFVQEQALRRDAIRQIGWVTLPPGVSGGVHEHTDTEGVYVIVSGRGVFTDSEGNTHEVGPGDIAIARRGQKHGIASHADEGLVFIDIIAENDGAKVAGLDDTKSQQLFPVAKQTVNNLVQYSGGLGITQGKVAFLKADAKEGEAFTEVGMATLRFGTAIGKHEHQHDENAYIVLYGKGIYTDSNGQEHVLKPMSVAVAGLGQSHAIRNDSMEDLVFITVSARNFLPGRDEE